MITDKLYRRVTKMWGQSEMFQRLAIATLLIAPVLLIFLLSNEKGGRNEATGILNQREYEVVLTKNGFTPLELTVYVGDYVKFSTNTNQYFWPASDIHPTHTIYPKFDPKEPIPSNKSWTFKFDKAGIWKYHDHLSPYFTGIIITRGGSKFE